MKDGTPSLPISLSPCLASPRGQESGGQVTHLRQVNLRADGHLLQLSGKTVLWVPGLVFAEGLVHLLRAPAMVIHAVYENGLFRPVSPVELPDKCEVDLTIHPSGPRSTAAPGAAPLAGIAAIAGEHPENSNLPHDLAEQHDHYLYGTAKRP